VRGEYAIDDVGNAEAVENLREDDGAVTAHATSVSLHDGEVGADERREIGLVDHEQIGLRDAGSTLPRDRSRGRVDPASRNPICS